VPKGTPGCEGLGTRVLALREFGSEKVDLRTFSTRISKMDHTLINYVHVLAIAPLFLYVGLVRNVPDVVFTLLGFLAAVMFLYHGYRAYQKLRDGKSAWVNWIHLFFIVPLLLLLARYKKEASRRYFEMLLLLGFSALGYHIMYIARETMFT